MKNLTLIFLTVLFTTSLSTLRAQTAAGTYPPEQLKAAERLLNAADVGNAIQSAFATVIKAQSQQVPEDKRAVFTEIMTNFFKKYLTTDAVMKGLIPIYASEYSTQELNAIADFLSTPAGKAMTARQADLTGKSMLWGQNIVKDHQEELQTMIKNAFPEK